MFCILIFETSLSDFSVEKGYACFSIDFWILNSNCTLFVLFLGLQKKKPTGFEPFFLGLNEYCFDEFDRMFIEFDLKTGLQVERLTMEILYVEHCAMS